MVENKKIKLTEKNLLRYGEIVLTREWTTPSKSLVTERYIIWDTCKMNVEVDPKVLANAENKKRMYLLTMVDGNPITMKQI